MKVDIRPARESEMDEYRRVALSALMISPNILPPEAINAIAPDKTLCAFVEGKLATAYAWWPLKMFINGAVVPVAGITFVGTSPVFRRKGLLRQVVQKHFDTLHADGRQPLTVLYASQAAIYQRYGYAVVSTRNAYEVAPRHLRFVDTSLPFTPQGTLRELAPDELEPLTSLYQSFCRQRTGCLDRSKAWWSASPLKPPARSEVLGKVVYEEESHALGYVIYTIAACNVPRGKPWQQITVRDMAWLTPAAYRAVWEHFSSMDLAMHVSTMFSPADDPLPHLIEEPRQLNTTSSDGLLARIVDLERVVALRPFCGEGELAFEIKDPLCPWNNGCWQLRASGGRANITRAGGPTAATIPIDTMAMLLFGQISAAEAVRMGRMTMDDPSALPLWDRVLGTYYKPFCPDFF